MTNLYASYTIFKMLFEGIWHVLIDVMLYQRMITFGWVKRFFYDKVHPINPGNVTSYCHTYVHAVPLRTNCILECKASSVDTCIRLKYHCDYRWCGSEARGSRLSSCSVQEGITGIWSIVKCQWIIAVLQVEKGFKLHEYSDSYNRKHALCW